jgi:hypothetical protein
MRAPPLRDGAAVVKLKTHRMTLVPLWVTETRHFGVETSHAKLLAIER